MELHEHARRMLAETRAIAAPLREHSRLLRGDLRLVVNTAAPYHSLPEFLAAFLISNPGFDLTIAERPSRDAVEAVRAPCGLGHRSGSCRFRRAGAAGLADVAREPFLGLGEGAALQRLVEDRAAREVGRLRIRARMGNAEQLLRMVAAGAGLAIVPQVVLEAAGHGVARARLDEPWAERQLHLVWSGERLSPPLGRLIEHISASA